MSRAIITFGRFNPPHRGHGLVFDKMQELSESFEADRKIFVSHSFDSKKNPLAYREKLAFMRKLFPEHREYVTRSKARTIIDIMQLLENDYDSVTLVLGEDRVEDMSLMLLRYNGKEYNFEEIDVVSAGERTENDLDSQASASKQREFVVEDNYEEFVKFLPENTNKKTAQLLFNTVEMRLGLTRPEPMTFREFIEVFNEPDMDKRQDLIESYKKRR